jgi:hypothetical protein
MGVEQERKNSRGFGTPTLIVTCGCVMAMKDIKTVVTLS